VRETSSSGQTRVREIDEVPEAVKPASTEAIEGEVDFEKITTLDHVRSLTADQWAKLRASDPGKAEALLRKASEAMTERAAEMRSGGLDLFEVAE